MNKITPEMINRFNDIVDVRGEGVIRLDLHKEGAEVKLRSMAFIEDYTINFNNEFYETLDECFNDFGINVEYDKENQVVRSL